jgi:hypothetical protein
MSNKDLPVWWWAGAPLVMLAISLVAFFVSPELMQAVIRKDVDAGGGGIAEHGTVLILVPGIVAGVAMLWHYRTRMPLWLAGWVLAWTLACLYFAGEEASWGQHYFHWGTPETLKGINDQQETNLHNIGTWFDQKPRTLIELWVVVAGLILPLWWRWRPRPARAVAGWRHWFWPTPVGTVAAGLFVASLLLNVLAKRLEWHNLVPLGSNELREYYIAAFLSTYLLSIWYRLRQPATA